MQYVNTGDWVESCTAVVEHFDGRMEILTWAKVLPEASAGNDALVPVDFIDLKGRAAQAA